MAEYILRPPQAQAPQSDSGFILKPPATPEKPGVIEDVVKSIPGAVPRASAGLFGFPQAAVEAVTSRIGNAIASAMGVDPSKVQDIIKPELPNIGEIITRGWDEISKETTGKPVYTPQTGPGRVADVVTQTMVGGPGSMVQKAVTGGAAGLSGEAARASGINNPMLIGVVQLLGGTAASLPFILRSVPSQNINAAIKDITPDQLSKAQQLMDNARRMGSPLTGAEAIAQVTGRNTLQDIQRVVESSQKGGPVMQPMMNERPQANRQMFTQQADAIAPQPAVPSETPARMQQAGQNAITAARRAGNAQAEPLYQQAAQQRVPASEWANLTNDPAVLKALQTVKNDPIWGVTKEAEGSIRWLDAAKRWIDDQSRSAQPSEARIWDAANTALKKVADAASPDYAKARGIIADNRQNVVDPMKNSPVGGIADTGAGHMGQKPSAESMMSAQSGILMPQTPRALNPATIRKTVETLGKQDPTAARDWARQNLQAIFDEATQKLVSGENPAGGAKFAVQIAGNPSQKENLRTLIESVSDRQTWVGFNRMLEVMEAQGKRQAAGSQTEFNKQISGNLSQGGAGALPVAVASPNRALSLVADWYDRFRYSKNSAEMAAILVDPRSVDLMRSLAKEAPTSARATALTAAILSLQEPSTIAPQSNSGR